MNFSENKTNSAIDKDTVFIFGGAALLLFGAGLILSAPLARGFLEEFETGNLIQSALSDINRYVKLRSM